LPYGNGVKMAAHREIGQQWRCAALQRRCAAVAAALCGSSSVVVWQYSSSGIDNSCKQLSPLA